MRHSITALVCATLLGSLFVLAVPFPGPGVSSVLAYEGELEWESVPRPGIVRVNYRERPDGERLRQRLIVDIRNAEPRADLDVFIKERHIGRVRTDRRGRAELVLDHRGVRPGADGRPRPGRRVDEGDVCTVVDVTGSTFADPFATLQ